MTSPKVVASVSKATEEKEPEIAASEDAVIADEARRDVEVVHPSESDDMGAAAVSGASPLECGFDEKGELLRVVG